MIWFLDLLFRNKHIVVKQPVISTASYEVSQLLSRQSICYSCCQSHHTLALTHFFFNYLNQRLQRFSFKILTCRTINGILIRKTILHIRK